MTMRSRAKGEMGPWREGRRWQSDRWGVAFLVQRGNEGTLRRDLAPVTQLCPPDPYFSKDYPATQSFAKGEETDE